MSMDVQALYQEKLMTIEEAVGYVENGSNVILGMSVAMPPGLITGLSRRIESGDLDKIYLYYMHGSQTLQNTLLQEALQEVVCPRPMFMSAFDRHAIPQEHQGWMQFVPATFHQVGRLLTEHIDPECFMVTVSPMDQHGYFSLGTNADYGATVIRKAKRIIVEVNHHMPRTFGECSVHISEIDHIVEHDKPLMSASPAMPSDVDLAIARQISEMIKDGDTLQMGVGGVPNAVLGELTQHQDLGLHTELFSPAMVDLIKSGVINGHRKSVMPYKHVFTLAIGDEAMYRFMDNNPAIVGYPAAWVNHPNVIRKNRNMISVNAALEVDLTGQINAEQINGHPFSGTGGQLDFVRGAYASENGRSVIALHSTAKNQSVSKIVPRIQGGVVTDPRMDTHFIVTEFGAVNMKGLSISQRAKALIELAHPKFRDELRFEAQKLGNI